MTNFKWYTLRLSSALACSLGFTMATNPCSAQTIHVDATPGHEVNKFVPTEALGAGIDRINITATDKLFTEPVMKQVLSAGWQTVSYRQNTELFIEAWHSHVERSGRPRLFRWQPQAGRFYSAFVRLQPSASRFHA